MTYKPGIPLPTDRPSVSQNDLKNNFTALNNIFKINHYEYDWGTVGDRGKHRYVTYVTQLAVDPVAGASEWITYAGNAPFTVGNSVPYIANNAKKYSLPIIVNPPDVLTIIGNTTIIDLAGYPNMIGIAFAYDTGTPDRTCLEVFNYIGGIVTSSNGFAPLSSGSIEYFLGLGSKLQVHTSLAINKIRTRIIAVPL
jgi:hypothetical protein